MEKATGIVELIDYAHPMMMAERHLKNAHNALLEGSNDEALGELMQAIVETKLAIHSIKLMEEKK